MSTPWIEDPRGLLSAGDGGGDDVITEGFDRRFYRPLRPGVWLTADVTFYGWQEGSFDKTPTRAAVIERQIEFSMVEGASYDNGNISHVDIREVTARECATAPTDGDARAACAAFDPAVLDWDGTTPIPGECWSVGLS